jgi:hypothetical protein
MPIYQIHRWIHWIFIRGTKLGCGTRGLMEYPLLLDEVFQIFNFFGQLYFIIVKLFKLIDRQKQCLMQILRCSCSIQQILDLIKASRNLLILTFLLFVLKHIEQFFRINDHLLFLHLDHPLHFFRG